MFRSAPVGVWFLSVACALAPTPTEADRRTDHQRGSAVSLLSGGMPTWTYHFDAAGGFPYFHPLTLGDGAVLTAFSPEDHPWHRGLWFSWKFINGVNYWDWAGKKESVPNGMTERVGVETVRGGGQQPVTIEMTLQYKHGADIVATEKRRVVVSLPQPDGSYLLDWSATFTAPDKKVVFDRTPPGEVFYGGYGGFTYRATKDLCEIRVVDSEGRTAKDGHGKQARWMDFSGKIGRDGVIAGVTIFDHPKNPRHPTPWYVETQGIQFFGPAMLFHKPFQLSAGESFALRYRVLVHPGYGEAAILAKHWKTFAALEAFTAWPESDH